MDNDPETNEFTFVMAEYIAGEDGELNTYNTLWKMPLDAEIVQAGFFARIINWFRDLFARIRDFFTGLFGGF